MRQNCEVYQVSTLFLNLTIPYVEYRYKEIDYALIEINPKSC